MQEKENLGKYIEARRKELSLTQKDLADLLSYSPQGISKLEKDAEGISISLLPPLASALRCSIDDLFNRNKKPFYNPNLSYDLNDFGLKMLQIRLKSGLSRKDAAIKLGVSNKTLYAYEKEKSEPTFKVVEQFMEIFKVDFSTILLQTPKRGLSSKNMKILASVGAILVFVGVGVGLLIPYLGRVDNGGESSAPSSSHMDETTVPASSIITASSQNDAAQQPSIPEELPENSAAETQSEFIVEESEESEESESDSIEETSEE